MKVTHTLHTTLLLSVALLLNTLTSCIKKEAPNAEADILKIEVSGVTLLRDATITNNEVKMMAAEEENITAVVPTFTLSKGATIMPASGVAMDFTNPVIYTVTAEDKTTQKKYKVSIQKISTGKQEDPKQEDPTITFSFEEVRTQGESPAEKHHVFLYKNIAGMADGEWASSNLGYALTTQAKAPTDFPASQDDNGYKGKCLKLMTNDPGPAGAMFQAYLATGSIFLGTLNPKELIGSPLKSTHFGVPFTSIPTKFSGFYKYKAGEIYQEKDQVIEDKKDLFALYAVMYEVTDKLPYLDGTNSLTSENIVLIANLDNPKEANDWTSFEVPFKEVNGKKIDKKKLKEGKYNFTIIASSSKDGAQHFGAKGSTLHLDELTVTLEKEK